MTATNRIFLRTTAATIGVLLIVGLSACAAPRAQTTDQGPATRVPTPTPSTAVTSESAQREAMVDKCFANPSCRLEVTGEELETVCQSVWLAEPIDGRDGRQHLFLLDVAEQTGVADLA